MKPALLHVPTQSSRSSLPIVKGPPYLAWKVAVVEYLMSKGISKVPDVNFYNRVQRNILQVPKSHFNSLWKYYYINLLSPSTIWKGEQEKRINQERSELSTITLNASHLILPEYILKTKLKKKRLRRKLSRGEPEKPENVLSTWKVTYSTLIGKFDPVTYTP